MLDWLQIGELKEEIIIALFSNKFQ